MFLKKSQAETLPVPSWIYLALGTWVIKVSINGENVFYVWNHIVPILLAVVCNVLSVYFLLKNAQCFIPTDMLVMS